MPETLISVDIKCSGRAFGRQYSMLSLGACVIGQPEKRFYCEIKPIGRMYLTRSMQILSQGLLCLQHLHGNSYNPNHPDFSPQTVLDVLDQYGHSPMNVMAEFRHWLLMESKGKPVLVSDFPSLDWTYIEYYFILAGEKNPFRRYLDSGQILSEEKFGNLPIDCSMINIPGNPNPPHNALEDALLNGDILGQIMAHNQHIIPALYAA